MSDAYDDNKDSDRLHRIINGLIRYFDELPDNQTYAQKQETMLGMLTATCVFAVETFGAQTGYSFMLYNLSSAYKKVCLGMQIPHDPEIIGMCTPESEEKIN